MVIHHLNCGTLHPPSQRVVNGFGRLTGPATLVCHCLLVETENGWTLIDTGLGTRDVVRPVRAHLRGWFTTLTRPVLDVGETAIAQVVAPSVAGRLHPEQWSGPVRWTPADLAETHLGRPSARISDSVRLVDLPGHIAGHCGVLVDCPGQAPARR